MHAIAFPKQAYSLDTYEGGEGVEHETYRVDQEYYDKPAVTVREARSIRDAIPALSWRSQINAEARLRMSANQSL
jgi:hypothetical protein